MSDYYKPRWALFLKDLINSLESHTMFDQDKFKTEVFDQVELPFTLQKKVHFVEKAQSKFVKL